LTIQKGFGYEGNTYVCQQSRNVPLRSGDTNKGSSEANFVIGMEACHGKTSYCHQGLENYLRYCGSEKDKDV